MEELVKRDEPVIVRSDHPEDRLLGGLLLRRENTRDRDESVVLGHECVSMEAVPIDVEVAAPVCEGVSQFVGGHVRGEMQGRRLIEATAAGEVIEGHESAQRVLLVETHREYTLRAAAPFEAVGGDLNCVSCSRHQHWHFNQNT